MGVQIARDWRIGNQDPHLVDAGGHLSLISQEPWIPFGRLAAEERMVEGEGEGFEVPGV